MTNDLVTRTAIALCAVLGILLTSSIPTIGAQSLGDVARRETERRKQAASGKVYTDGDLAPSDASTARAPEGQVESAPESSGDTPKTPPAPGQARPPAKPGTEPVLIAGRQKRDEQYWRTLARDLRGRLAKAGSDVAAREARITEIDAAPQTPTSVRERETLEASLPRLQRDARSLSEELTRFLTRAQMANVPDDWIR